MLELANTSMGFLYLSIVSGFGLLELVVVLTFAFCVEDPPLNGSDALAGA
jgi:hypothetical protein